MAEDHPGPESLTIRGIPGARRGLDRRAVEQMLEDAAREWSALRDEHAVLTARIEHAGGLEYLAKDLGAIASEIGAVLQAATEAAHGIRTRASKDSEERVRAAVVEARRIVADAESQAFDLRESAWQASTELLEQVKSVAARMIERAEADVLVIRAEAEQEAHRRVAAAKKESDDAVRNARYEADRMVNEARAKADELIGESRRDAEAAQERTRALEARRKRLMADIDEARVSRLSPGDVAEEPGRPDADEDEPEEGTSTRLAGAGIRIINPPSTRPRSPAEELGFDDLDPRHPGYGDALADEVGRLAEPTADRLDAGPAEPIASASAAPSPVRVRTPDKVSDLFARLRQTTGETPVVRAPEREQHQPQEREQEPERRATADLPEDVLEAQPKPVAPDPLALRDRLLLGVQNAGLRMVKDLLMEWQNAALDQIRVDGEWIPDGGSIGSRLSPVIEEMVAAAGRAGAEAVAETIGNPPHDPSPSRRAVALATPMREDLVRKLSAAAGRMAESGPKELSAELSRVFRAWRSDDAERWVRSVARAGYHDAFVEGLAAAGVAEVVGVAHGATCAECPAGRGPWRVDADPPAGSLAPPAHLECTCTIAPA